MVPIAVSAACQWIDLVHRVTSRDESLDDQTVRTLSADGNFSWIGNVRSETTVYSPDAVHAVVHTKFCEQLSCFCHQRDVVMVLGPVQSQIDHSLPPSVL